MARDEYEDTRGAGRSRPGSPTCCCSRAAFPPASTISSSSVLADFGAEFYFDRVLIQPGQPLVFGRARDKFFFGLPGNPASTMVTFEIFARAAAGTARAARTNRRCICRSRGSPREFRHHSRADAFPARPPAARRRAR